MVPKIKLVFTAVYHWLVVTLLISGGLWCWINFQVHVLGNTVMMGG